MGVYKACMHTNGKIKNQKNLLEADTNNKKTSSIRHF